MAASRKSIATEIGSAALPVLAGAWFYARNWLETFPLIEYRNWLAYPFAWRSVRELLFHLFFREIPFSRDVSLFTVQLTAATCGLDIHCLNAIPIGFLVASDLLLYLLVRRLVASPAFACLAALLWMFSRPVLDAASWQATHHDKAAVLFSLLALHAALAFRAPRPGLGRIVAANLAIGALTMLAYNSKEAAWGLVPCLLLSGIATGDGPWRRWLRETAPLLILPTLYAAYQNARYFVAFQDDLPWKIHVTTGDPIDNLRLYLGFLINEPAFTPWALLPAAAVAAAIAARVAAWSRPLPGRTARLAGVVLWAAFGWAVSTAIVLRLQYPSGFHMVVPAAYFHLLVAAGLALAFESQPVRSWRRAIVAAASIATGLLLLHHSVRSYSEYQAIRERSVAFMAGFPAFARSIPVAGDEPIYLVSADSRYDAYMFLGEPQARDIYQYIYGQFTPDASFEARFRNLTRSELDAKPGREAAAYYAFFDDRMRLVAIDHGTRPLFREP